MELEKHTIGVIMGGVSAEREVSLSSGKAVCRALKDLGLTYVEIDADETLCEKLKGDNVTFAFIILHGGWGEDGSLQGMLNILNIPFSGSGVLASALAMNKEASKKLFMYHGLNVSPFLIIDGRSQDISEDLYLKRGLDIPLFVKPVSEGSSVGVSFVKERADFIKAVEEALRYGERVLVEKYIKGKEIQIGILGDKVLGGVEVRPPSEFYDYTAKYKGGTEYILPPELEPKINEKAGETGLRAHMALGCSGATRIDLIVDESNEIYVLEVNTIPGMTETSLLPKIAALAGYEFKSLVKEIILDGLRSGGKG